MRILLINWQDRENPQAGGAEVYDHEVFGRLAARGHEVVMLCGGAPGLPARTTLDGMELHRVGGRYSFTLAALPYYRRRLAGRPFDVVYEDLAKIPLFTPLWRMNAKRLVAHVHHLFGDVAFQEAPLPMAATVWLTERPIPLVYRSLPFQAVSASTADDLVRRGIPRAAIRVIHNGSDVGFFTPEPGARAERPVFLYLGRLKRYKGVDLVIRAFAEAGLPDATLEIAGKGDHRPELERLADSLALGNRVRFLGFVDESEKRRLLRRAWALAFASPKEGWGITNLEAAACGTPVIASDSPGLRESVRHGETGFLVRHGDVPAMAVWFRRIAADRALVDTLGRGGRRFAETFTWERAADETEAHFEQLLTGGG